MTTAESRECPTAFEPRVDHRSRRLLALSGIAFI